MANENSALTSTVNTFKTVI